MWRRARSPLDTDRSSRAQGSRGARTRDTGSRHAVVPPVGGLADRDRLLGGRNLSRWNPHGPRSSREPTRARPGNRGPPTIAGGATERGASTHASISPAAAAGFTYLPRYGWSSCDDRIHSVRVSLSASPGWIRRAPTGGYEPTPGPCDPGSEAILDRWPPRGLVPRWPVALGGASGLRSACRVRVAPSATSDAALRRRRRPRARVRLHEASLLMQMTKIVISVHLGLHSQSH